MGKKFDIGDIVIINKKVKHQNIGGKKGVIDRKISKDDLLFRINDIYIADYNFSNRRPDLFTLSDKSKIIFSKYGKTLDYYYMHINGLGYIVASDEIKHWKSLTSTINRIRNFIFNHRGV